MFAYFQAAISDSYFRKISNAISKSVLINEAANTEILLCQNIKYE